VPDDITIAVTTQPEPQENPAAEETATPNLAVEMGLADVAGRLAAMAERLDTLHRTVERLEETMADHAHRIDEQAQVQQQVDEEIDELALLVDALGQLVVEEEEEPEKESPEPAKSETPPQPANIPTEPPSKMRKRLGLYAERFGKE